MQTQYAVTRVHLKSALDALNLNLLDKLLEMDNSGINDNSLYTDTWGEWWGLLMEAIRLDSLDAVKILLKHGADRTKGTWGDCIPQSPLEVAAEKPGIHALLKSRERPVWQRTAEPELPRELSAEDLELVRKGEIRDRTGLVFQ